MTFKARTTIEVSERRIEDMLIGAFEGGSNDWIEYVEKISESGNDWIYKDPFSDIGIRIHVVVDFTTVEEEDTFILNKESLQKGIDAMSSRQSRHFSDMIEENDDAITADVFLQCCLFGEIVFG